MLIVIIIVLMAFLAVTLLALAIGGLLGADREAVARRLDALTPQTASADPLPSLAEVQLEGSWSERLWQPVLRRLARLGLRLLPSGQSERLRSALARAGNPSGLGEGEFAGLRVLSVFGCLVFALPFCWLVPQWGARMLLLILAVVVGLTLPDALLEQAIQQRQARIRRALPDAIDLLVVSVEAGMGLDGALAKVTEKMRGPLSEELARAMDAVRLGKTRSQALKDMAARLDMGEVKTFVAAVTQAELLGASIVQTLRAQSRMTRAARLQRVREQAAQLPVTLLFPLVVFIFPAIFVVLLGPSLIRLYQALTRMG